MSTIAKNGNRAEKVLSTQDNLKPAFEAYFQKPIASISMVPGRKKSDNVINFSDGTKVQIQNKDGDGSGRGWSVDRRDLKDHGTDTDFHTLLQSVCLRGNTTRPTISQEISRQTLSQIIFGSDPAFQPEFITHTISDKTTGQITKISICPAKTFMDALLEELYPTMVPKRTCVHLSPSIYLQRKGGGKTDNNPDHIQAKLRFNEKIAALFTVVDLISYQTNQQSEAQMPAEH